MAMVALLAALAAEAAAAADYDVVVYGSSPAGIAAATAAGVLGLKVALYEPLPMIGGMGAAGNLALNDGGNGAEHTGLALNFTRANAEWYCKEGITSVCSNTSQVSHPESFVSEASFRKMLGTAGIGAERIKTDCRVLSATTGGTPSKITSAKLLCENAPITATVWIDASYDGDLMVAAGDIDYTWGREATTTYNETLAGARAPSWAGVSGPKGVDAVGPDGKLLKYVYPLSELKPPGSADDALMAFQHRMCISGDADRVAWPKPEGYKKEDFLLMQRALDVAGTTQFSMPGSALPGYPGKKKKYCNCCGISVAASDQPTLNSGWANASWERKQQIIEDHKYFELGTLYYFSHDVTGKYAEATKKRFNSYGLCADEFVGNGHLPYQLYVRISNRLVGDYVMTQSNIGNPRRKDDSIGVADWSYDEHMTGKYAVPTANGTGYEVMLEGNFWPSISVYSKEHAGGNWYDVPYKIMVPKRGQGANLLVPVALSASAVAFSSTRIENMYMNVGSAAGVAAKQLVDGIAPTVQDVNVAIVQKILTEIFNQRIHGPPGHGAAPPPPAPAPPYHGPTSFTVEAAGAAAWNGVYNYSSGTGRFVRVSAITHDAQQHRQQQEETAEEEHSLYSNGGGEWRLAVFGQKLAYISKTISKTTPPLDGWVVPPHSSGSAPVVGVAPAPHLVVTP